ncbi:glycosyltransferase family 25 protein [Pararhodospirillum oryzae]|uniref:Glycosyl transferase n=1 Tax=Pararhodospirillum oryzae TaxID=478448 RepID=A0A512H6B2_9PROT|nr:glycosyltransferase family 25 protein [Pararhodospirillum oryzae]GEO80974.1 glycosyl transferase [Pararhodospirillum oryzae]
MSLPVFVVSLPDALERRALMAGELARVGLEATFVDGITPAQLTPADWARYDRARCLGVYGVEMLPTEIACFLAHERAIRKVVDEDLDAALILEDDVRLDDALPGVLDALLHPPTPWPRPWALVRLGSLRAAAMARAVARHPAEGPLGPDHVLVRPRTHILGLQGYVITREGARRVLAYTQRLFMPIDHTVDRYWENGLVPFLVHPFVVTHRDELPSAIGARDPERRYAGSRWTLWRRRFNRWRDGLNKRVYRLLNP